MSRGLIEVPLGLEVAFPGGTIRHSFAGLPGPRLVRTLARAHLSMTNSGGAIKTTNTSQAYACAIRAVAWFFFEQCDSDDLRGLDAAGYRQLIAALGSRHLEGSAALEREVSDPMGKLNDPVDREFLPYVLVRSVVGDRGDRPLNVPFWESPDIWTAPGDPSTSPVVPATLGGELTAGQPSTVYAHVWNYGLAPVAGVVVEFYWFNPSLSIDGSQANLIGTARCDLSPLGMAGSDLLVKCPEPWVPVMENGGHECLVVRVSGIGDPVGNDGWAPWRNRHVAQRNVSVVASAAISAMLLTSLSAITFGTKVQLIQLSPVDGEVAAKIVAPRATLAAELVTHVLGEIGQDNLVKLSYPEIVPAGVLAPVDPLIEGGPPAAPGLHASGAAAVIDAGRLVAGLTDAQRQLKVAALLGGIRALHGGVSLLANPVADQAQVLRLANYDADGQLVGGYTIVLAQT